jgi:hypothetical protein
VRRHTFRAAKARTSIQPPGPTGNKSSFNFQTPYLIKLLSSTPLFEHVTFYFYGIFAEKGGNGETLIEDAGFRHDDLFGTGVAGQIGNCRSPI